MREILLGTYSINTVTLLPDRSLDLNDRFGRPMLDPFRGFADINLHEFTLNPNLPQYDRLEIITATSQYAYLNTVDQLVGYLADSVDSSGSSLIYRSYNQGNAIYDLYPWTNGDPNYYDSANIFPGAVLNPPYYNNTYPGLTYSTKFLYLGFYVLTAKLYRTVEDEPCYLDLVTGYALDNRIIPSNPVITPSKNKNISIEYYQRNTLESIPNLTSICWRVYQCELKAGVPIQLPINNIVLGTLYSDDPTVLSAIALLPVTANYYRWIDLFPSSISNLFTTWNQIYLALYPNTNNSLSHIIIHKLAANNNYWNNTNLSNNVDINFDATHPMFAIDNQRAYTWHIKPQSDGSYGDLIMDSPRTIEMHKALQASNYLTEVPAIIGTGTIDNPQFPAKHTLGYWISHPVVGDSVKVDQIHTALNVTQYLKEEPAMPAIGSEPATLAKHKLDYYINKLQSIWTALDGDTYAINDIDSADPRITTLGWLVNRLCEVNGIRLDANGELNLVAEKAYLPQTLHDPVLGIKTVKGKPDDRGKYHQYGVSSFGTKGMMIPHLPTSYNAQHREEKLFDVVHDHPQLAVAILRQFDVALGIQHGSEIRVNGMDGKVQSYPNQLAMLLEMLLRLEKVSYQTSKNLLVSTVTGSEVRELFSGIGIPVTQKFLPLKDPSIGKGVLSLPYFGHQKNKPSTAGLINTALINIAVINGVLMPKKQPDKNISNPFKHFTPKE